MDEELCVRARTFPLREIWAWHDGLISNRYGIEHTIIRYLIFKNRKSMHLQTKERERDVKRRCYFADR